LVVEDAQVEGVEQPALGLRRYDPQKVAQVEQLSPRGRWLGVRIVGSRKSDRNARIRRTSTVVA
jgi:hypothetical protein